jgi:hypothetical protein
MNNKSAGRPNDKNLYIDALMSNINVSDENNNEDIVKALTKLNAKELLLLNAYFAKSNNVDLRHFLRNIPEKTVAQTRRYKSIVDRYNDLKGRTNERIREATKSERPEETNSGEETNSFPF